MPLERICICGVSLPLCVVFCGKYSLHFLAEKTVTRNTHFACVEAGGGGAGLNICCWCEHVNGGLSFVRECVYIFHKFTVSSLMQCSCRDPGACIAAASGLSRENAPPKLTHI